MQVVVNSRRVLITGCSGFIGRALAEACMAEGWGVKGGLRTQPSQASLPVGVEPVLVSDIGPGTDWTEALNRVDAVVHLAARAHREREESAEPGAGAAYFHTNTAGTERLAVAAAEAGVKRLVFLSTLKVNGENRTEVCRESDPEAPCGPYAVSKFEAENVLREISIRTGLQTVILRPPLVYGPGVKANFLRLVRLVEGRIPLPFGSLVNQRSMLFLGNLTNAILVCLKNPNAGGKTYLVADNEIVSTPYLIREIAGLLGMKPKLYSCPPAVLIMAARLAGRRAELDRLMGSLWADTSKIRQELGWKAEYSFQEGLKTTIGWYCATASGRTRVKRRPKRTPMDGTP